MLFLQFFIVIFMPNIFHLHLIKTVHIIGITGIGMSAIAKMLYKLGFNVQGSDIIEAVDPKILNLKHIKYFLGHMPENIIGADIVIFSTAIDDTNIEIIEAKKRGLKILSRKEVLLEITKRYETKICISGAHGKTTTTSMACHMFNHVGENFDAICGGVMREFSSNVVITNDANTIILEADESDGTFCFIENDIAIITNIEDDHLDYYGSFENLFLAFKKFALKANRCVILSQDCQYNLELIDYLNLTNINYLTYSIYNTTADIFASDILNIGHNALSYKVHLNHELLIKEKEFLVELGAIGKHNIANSLAILSLAYLCNIDMHKAVSSLCTFTGTLKRTDVLFHDNDMTIIYDYAHHPTEINATIHTFQASFPDRMIIAIIQPHRYTRVKTMVGKFIKCFGVADYTFVLPIFKARDGILEKPTTEELVSICKAYNIMYLDNISRLQKKLDYIYMLDNRKVVLIFMGAGDIDVMSKDFVSEFFIKKNNH